MKWIDCVLAVAVTLSALCVPYTKVEESFFMQAIHDILKWGRVNDSFDHLEFPGVVPRSFVGPLLISALTYPANYLYGNQSEGLSTQILARLVLGWLVVWANAQFRKEIERVFGSQTALWYGVFGACQFHFTFWTSRMLGNTLALVPMLWAQKYWLRSMFATSGARRQRGLCYMSLILAFTCVVLRFDTAVFAATMLASRLSMINVRVICTLAAAVTASGLLSLAVDSYYWRQRWMWPEFRVFWFNIVLGRSSEWGVSPPHYYFTHFIPRLLLGALPFAGIGILANRRAAQLAAAYIVSIAVFSANAHKEWRFILPAVPIGNLCAALGVARLDQVPTLRLPTRLMAMALAASSLALAVMMTYISSLNYPGGFALALLHSTESSSDVRVHIDTYAAMTGVTRFGQLNHNWIYNKTEGLAPAQFGNFTHLLTSNPKQHSGNGFSVTAVESGYAGLDVRPRLLLSAELPVSARLQPLVWIMRRDDAPS
ncbi:hypothetical protein LPJ63_000685 [Coemansia sp. RSA 2711]|nr:hypothetical protein LPJ63_000685 [Coemansia sp. RSA 2711]